MDPGRSGYVLPIYISMKRGWEGQRQRERHITSSSNCYISPKLILIQVDTLRFLLWIFTLGLIYHHSEICHIHIHSIKLIHILRTQRGLRTQTMLISEMSIFWFIKLWHGIQLKIMGCRIAKICATIHCVNKASYNAQK